jgi:hypothetical protein
MPLYRENGQLYEVIKTTTISGTPLEISSTFDESPANTKETGGLTAGEIWNNTGTGDDVSEYGTITVSVYSDQDSAVDGLKFEGSFDGSTWLAMEHYTYKASGGLQVFSMAPGAKYFRVRFENGAAPSTATRIQTFYRQCYTKPSSHRISDVITGEKDAELVKAVLAAEKPDGNFVDINATAGGNLKVSVEETEGAVPVVGALYQSVINFTRPSNATAYTAGDVIGIADSGTPANAGSAVFTLTGISSSGGAVIVQNVRLAINSTSVPSGMGAFRLHLYSANPSGILDNAPYDLVSGELSSYIDYIDLPAPQDFGSVLFTKADYPGTTARVASGQTSLYAELETRGAFTPSSGTLFSLRVSTLEAGI